MKSPFPGMDPYLEAYWSSVHTQLIALSTLDLNDRLPAELSAYPEERIEVLGGDELNDSPDLEIIDDGGEPVSSAAKTFAEAVGEYGAIRLVTRVEPATERQLQIVEQGSEKIVTIIEFLSPSNKRSPGLEEYREKRADFLDAGVNFVEIDLVRRGKWRALLAPYAAPANRQTPYRVTIRSQFDREAVLLYPVSIASPLPKLAIPLRRPDEQIVLDLQQMLERTYHSLKLWRRIKYSAPCEPPLTEEDALAARSILQAAGITVS